MGVTLTPPWGTIDGRLDQVWSGVGSGSVQVPHPYIVAINSHNYLHDLEFKPWKRQAMRATTVATTRTQADTSNEPGEQSLSTESLWRRTQDSWHLGAGQVYLDRKNSEEYSFRQSKGVNVWTEWQLTLLNDTTQTRTSVATNVQLVYVGTTYLYFISGTGTFYSNDNGVTFTAVTGTPASTATSIATDGYNIYIAYGSNGLYTTTVGAAGATQLVTSSLASTAVVRFVMGRLMVCNNNSLYNIVSTSPAALPTALLTALYSNLVWVDCAAGNGVIFAAGNSGNIGVVYSIQIEPDGTSLAPPIVCGQLPNGETINCIYGYAGSGLAIGSNLGFRFAEQALANGVAGTVSLTIGPLAPLPSPVTAFIGQGRFIYGTYENYDNVSTGLFRMDPSQFVSDLAPAYASDLMGTTQGAITGLAIDPRTSLPVFAVSGEGIYAATTTYVASGSLQSGFITYGLADPKMPVFIDIAMLPLPTGTSIQELVSLNNGSFTNVGTANQAGLSFEEFATPQSLSDTIEIEDVLYSDAATHLLTPTLTRHTLRGVPAPQAPTDWSVVVQLRERVRINDIEVVMVPSAEYAYLDRLRIEKQISILQVGNMGPLTVTIESIDWIPEQWAQPSGELNGVAVITCRTVV
jgi:hypothetical protein